MEGTNMSRESQVLAASMLPMFLDTASEPGSPRLASFAEHASLLVNVRHKENTHRTEFHEMET
jgi:hypothetical protein